MERQEKDLESCHKMVKVACQDPAFLDLLLDLVHTAWREKRVPEDWADAVIVPSPMKGNLV